jgi:hypothetical protein
MASEKLQGLIDKAVEEYRKDLQSKMEDLEKAAMAKIHGNGEYDINTVEKTFGVLLKRNYEITEDLISKANDRAFEKELVKKTGRSEGGGERAENRRAGASTAADPAWVYRTGKNSACGSDRRERRGETETAKAAGAS